MIMQNSKQFLVKSQSVVDKLNFFIHYDVLNMKQFGGWVRILYLRNSPLCKNGFSLKHILKTTYINYEYELFIAWLLFIWKL